MNNNFHEVLTLRGGALIPPAAVTGTVQPGRIPGLVLAGGSGLLYGLVNVLAKRVDMHPFWKTALLYLASAAFLSPFLRGLQILRRDRAKVFAMGFFGGGLAPILLCALLCLLAAALASLD